jgi:hypothetical protein
MMYQERYAIIIILLSPSELRNPLYCCSSSLISDGADAGWIYKLSGQGIRNMVHATYSHISYKPYSYAFADRTITTDCDCEIVK